MILAIDIGNSDITLGLSEGGQWRFIWRIPSVTEQPEIYYSLKLLDYFFESGVHREEVSQVVISSVVPELTSKLVHVATSVFGKDPVLLGPEIYSKLPIGVLNPYEIGSDLVANALAAYKEFNDLCVVVDFGTALTFTTISKEGEIVGVSIAPGLKTAIRSLSQNTARLFDVPLEMPVSALGRGTVHAIQAGVLIGYEGMVRHMLDRIKSELKDEKINSIATGGLHSAIPPLSDVFTRIEPNLTLDGLRIVAEFVNGEGNEG